MRRDLEFPSRLPTPPENFVDQIRNGRGVNTCSICDGSVGRTHVAQERMFGLPGEFEYFECGTCGFLQLLNPPSDLAPFYPRQKYYSFTVKSRTEPGGDLDWVGRMGIVRRRLLIMRHESALFDRGLFGKLLRRLRPRSTNYLNYYKPFLSQVRTRRFSARVLDVGCGSGFLLSELSAIGFSRLEGVDPYMSGDDFKQRGIRLRRIHLCDLHDEKYDLIMFNHTLEHMPDQIQTLRLARQLLTETGVCRIEIPTVSGDAWSRYGVHWCELDAPRHLALHSVESMTRVVGRAGLRIKHVEYVGTPFEYWGSVLYTRGLTLFDPQRQRYLDASDVFTYEEQSEFEAMSRESNAANRGGRAVFWLDGR